VSWLTWRLQRSTIIAAMALVVVFVLMGPETKGKVLTADLETLKAAD